MNQQKNQQMKGWANEQVAINTIFLWIKTEQKWKQKKNLTSLRQDVMTNYETLLDHKGPKTWLK